MKKILFLFILSLSLQAGAQKYFEGMIRYMVTKKTKGDLTKRDLKGPDAIKIYFTPGKILMKTEGDESIDDVLVIFDSLKIWTFQKQDKTYRVKKLRYVKPSEPLGNVSILGYSASPLKSSQHMSEYAQAFANTWYADSLFFDMKEGFQINEELLVIHKKRILLRAHFGGDGYILDETIDDETYDDQHTATINFEPPDIILEAIEIKHGGINPEIFKIPAGYIPRKIFYEQRMEFTDSVAVAIDSIMESRPVEAEPIPPVQKNIPDNKTTRETPPKSPARKE